MRVVSTIFLGASVLTGSFLVGAAHLPKDWEKSLADNNDPNAGAPTLRFPMNQPQGSEPGMPPPRNPRNPVAGPQQAQLRRREDGDISEDMSGQIDNSDGNSDEEENSIPKPKNLNLIRGQAPMQWDHRFLIEVRPLQSETPRNKQRAAGLWCKFVL